MEENIGANLHDPGPGNGFLNVTPKAQQKQQKIDMLDFIKTKNMCGYKKAIKGIKKNSKTYLPIICIKRVS